MDDNLDGWEDDYGDGIKLKVEFKDKDKVSKDDIKDMNETFDDEGTKLNSMQTATNTKSKSRSRVTMMTILLKQPATQ